MEREAGAGEIVGAAIVAHVPPIVLDEAERRADNGGQDISLVRGLQQLRTEILDVIRPDTILVLDTHWFTTIHHILDARAHRRGVFTSSEIPTNPGMRSVPYDVPGDPELCAAIAATAAGRDDTWIVAEDEPNLPVHYATINLLRYLQGDERWVSASICQTATDEDFLLFGRLIADGVAASGRRVVILGSGGLSHRFWPLREIRRHESAAGTDIVSPEAYAADQDRLAWWAAGDHRRVLDTMDQYRSFQPEGFFGHYLTLVGAIGGRACQAPGRPLSDYEASAGTGQIQLWFDRPQAGWTSGGVVAE